MTPTDFRAALRRLGLTQPAAARALGKGERTVRRYAASAKPVPETVRLALAELERQAKAGGRGE